MAMPAARVGDLQVCAVPGHTPPIGTPIASPGQPAVRINGRFALTETSPCEGCSSAGPVLNLVEKDSGSQTVFIVKQPAARLLSSTTHKGRIESGSPNVLIGDYAGLAATKVFPGKQRWGNCGPLCCQQLIQQATGEHWEEDDFLDKAIAGGYATDNANPDLRGGMVMDVMPELLKDLGVPSSCVSSVLLRGNENFTEAQHLSITENFLTWAVREKRGIIAGVDSGKLWKNINQVGGGHVIVITEGVFNKDDRLTHVYINDTGKGKKGRCMTIEEILDAMYRPTRRFNYTMVVTDDPIWHQLTPPSPPPRRAPFPRLRTP